MHFLITYSISYPQFCFKSRAEKSQVYNFKGRKLLTATLPLWFQHEWPYRTVRVQSFEKVCSLISKYCKSCWKLSAKSACFLTMQFSTVQQFIYFRVTLLRQSCIGMIVPRSRWRFLISFVWFRRNRLFMLRYTVRRNSSEWYFSVIQLCLLFVNV